MASFLKKALLLLAPLILLTVSYVITDPYQSMPWHNIHAFDILMLSRGDISTKLYLKNINAYQYDSFIFGSSRTTAHTGAEWKKYLPQGNVPFSFSGWNETIAATYKRIKLIDSLNKPLNNAFMVIDVDQTFKSREINWDHYLVTGMSKYDYYLNDYIHYLQSPRLVIMSIDYKIFHKQRAYMQLFAGMKTGDLDLVNNDWEPNSEQKIITDSVNYYKNSLSKFYIRPPLQQISERQISATTLNILRKTKAIFNRRHTACKIVIAPIYDQVKINPVDLMLLKFIFGSQNVFDYSGINPITANKFNYGSDVLHYRKKVGNLIFSHVYNHHGSL
jgi:hypothetical protein